MLDRKTRIAILGLSQRGIGTRQIARSLKISRGAAKKVIASGEEAVPPLVRPSVLQEKREEVLDLRERCKGNLVRVREELQAAGIVVSYPVLTAFVRKEKPEPKVPVGRYVFAPGQEMQHDTSPHDVEIAGRVVRLQTASAVLGFSRMLFFQLYPRYRRFEAKIFLTRALCFFDGVVDQVMIDNSTVIAGHGTGASMVPAPEMAAFAERFGFVFRAHAVGDVNRSARVERQFSYIEGNFLAGRSFTSLSDLNTKAREWCEKVNATHKRDLHASPRDLFRTEKVHLRPLPLHIPEPELLVFRTADVEGYVSVDSNRYSVPLDWISRQVKVRMTETKVEIDEGGKTVVHERIPFPLDRRVQLPEHHFPRGEKAKKQRDLQEEGQLEVLLPGIGGYVAALKKNGKKAPVLLLRHLLRMAREYPEGPLRSALDEAARYGLFDLDRVERMVLARIDRDYFPRRGDDE